ncbi:MAG: hypothetical protein CM15mP111_2600 [Hyphomicrobiales bacterium]|nr:MAG: hypothetical protein CM15mP111_2600 [Hyphomicrobiales bacterium]
MLCCLPTIYDMIKSRDKKASITDIKLDFKSGGKSGIYKEMNLLKLENAIDRSLKRLMRGYVTIPLGTASGYVILKIYWPRCPPFDLSAMDGYAFKHSPY